MTRPTTRLALACQAAVLLVLVLLVVMARNAR
jgi:hypothetical protein